MTFRFRIISLQSEAHSTGLVCSQKNHRGTEAFVTVKTAVGNVVLETGWKLELNPPDRGVQGLAKVDWVAVYKI